MPASTDIVGPVIQSTFHSKLQEEWTLAAKEKKEELFHKVIIHLLKKENLQAAETDSGEEAGSSEK